MDIRPRRSSRDGHAHGKHSLANSYRRQSFAAGFARPALLASSPLPAGHLTAEEEEACHDEERELLRTSAQDTRAAGASNTSRAIPSENSPLLPKTDTDDLWDEAVEGNRVQSTWRHESRVLGRTSLPLIITFLLQASEQFSTVFSLGRLGTKELGASSLSTMVSAIMAFSLFQGCISSLDTLCPQAYGAGRKELVGVHVQRCLLLLVLLHIPVALVFLNGEALMLLLRQDPEIARLSGQYLQRFLLGVPAMAVFETLKRYTQAKGDFRAGTYCLFISAPINIVLNYVLVWDERIGIGFVGAPTAVVLTFWLQAGLLLLYIYFFDDKDAWGGFSKRAFSNWGPMIKLAIPGVLMILSEWAAFEVLSVFSSWLGTPQLAAQSILNTSSSILFQIPFAISVATATRIGNLVGAGTEQPARICARVAIGFGVVNAIAAAVLLFVFRKQWGHMFSRDPEVIVLVSEVIPFLAFFGCFDALAAVAQGVLRGLGKQAIAAAVNLPAYYAVALPAGIALAFPAHMGLYGIWIGMFPGLTHRRYHRDLCHQPNRLPQGD
ncbi:hypothetical protein PYCC9005_005553 [Savitreella phatthalungensis]